MSIVLPSQPGPSAATPSYVDYGGILRPTLGGPDQKLNRLGNRFSLAVTMPPMPSDRTARQWIAALIQAQRSGAIMEWPQLGFDVGAPGAFVVDGAGQSGLTLNLRAGTPAYAFRVGQFFSVVHGGRRYLHMLTAQAIAIGSGLTGAGSISAPVEPMLRIPYADGSLVEVGVPMIEGFLEGNSRDWTLDTAQTVGLSFKITEAE